MIILGSPRDVENYYIADVDVAFRLEQAGVHPKYMDDDAYYFLINRKLVRKLSDFGIYIDADI